MRTALPLAAFAITVVVLLSGCVPQEPEILPPPEPTSEPVFASDEEALAAATKAYEAYLAMSDLIAQEGGKDPERIAPYVTEEWLKQETRGTAELVKSGRRLVGNLKLLHASLQQVFGDATTSTTVVIYACISPNGAQVLNAASVDVTPNVLRRPWTTEATFVTTSGENSQLLLSRNEPWSSDSSCQ